jgi:hypothetical protein
LKRKEGKKYKKTTKTNNKILLNHFIKQVPLSMIICKKFYFMKIFRNLTKIPIKMFAFIFNILKNYAIIHIILYEKKEKL